MSTAREIADGRLARGEIAVEEHSKIVKSLLTQEASPPPPLPLQQPPPLPSGLKGAVPIGPATTKKTWLWIIGGSTAAVIFFGSIFLAVSEGLSVGNLQAEGIKLSFKLANNSSKSEDVLLWIEQNGIEKCERIVHVSAKSTYNIKLSCPALSSGKFFLKHVWASFDEDKARVATRIHIN